MSACLLSFLLLTSPWPGSILFPQPAGTSMAASWATRGAQLLSYPKLSVTIADSDLAIPFREHLGSTCTLDSNTSSAPSSCVGPAATSPPWALHLLSIAGASGSDPSGAVCISLWAEPLDDRQQVPAELEYQIMPFGL